VDWPDIPLAFNPKPQRRTTVKIFGREPAAWIALIGSILTVVAALNVPFLSAGQAAAATAVVAAGLIAYTTRPVAPSLLTGAFTALVALFAEYGLHLSDQLVGAISAAILALFAFITREQVSPQETAVTHA
jgi:hypothetical protein